MLEISIINMNKVLFLSWFLGIEYEFFINNILSTLWTYPEGTNPLCGPIHFVD
jgi:hypothetical protein